MKQAELAEKIGESSSTFSRFINGLTDKISPDAIILMAKEFEVSTDFLLGVVN
ncbi:MAG: helix-turn-helix transcriptional regulator [Ruminococcaceae bacterium]|nr:helix-turn-helix transcriptional regulator [Oscillospiraceae bacterium]